MDGAGRLPTAEYVDRMGKAASMPGDMARPVSSISGRRISATQR